jgi:hypothetical protein
MQICPVESKVPEYSRPNASSSRTASASTSAGSLPPSSNATRVSDSLAIAMIRLPPPGLPVKQTFFTRSSWMSAGPTSASVPVTTLSTPGGSSAATCCTVRTVASGQLGGGFTTTVLPASRAWGSEAARIASGQLNGTMIVTTPSGR